MSKTAVKQKSAAKGRFGGAAFAAAIPEQPRALQPIEYSEAERMTGQLACVRRNLSSGLLGVARLFWRDQLVGLSLAISDHPRPTSE